MSKEIIIYIILGLCGLIAFIFGVLRIKKINDGLAQIATDTLKKKDKDGVYKWSRTSLTMATAWGASLYAYFFDLHKNGFNITAFGIMAGIALGAKVTDAWSKKIDPTIGPENVNGQSV